MHLEQHVIEVTDDDGLDWTIRSFSTGREGHLTPLIAPGHMLTGPREEMHRSGRYRDAHGLPAAMPFSLFFDKVSGCAFHAGDPALLSHGCVHLAVDDAKRLFDWAGRDEVGLSIQRD